MTEARRAAWGIPTEQIVEYRRLYTLAEEALRRVSNLAERTHVLVIICTEMFAALKQKMRFFRNVYFKMPPLDLTDWAALGFRERRGRGAPGSAPEGAPVVTLDYRGRSHLLLVRLAPLPGTPAPGEGNEYEYAVYAGVMPPGGATLEQAAGVRHYLMAPPADGEGLRHRLFTRRKTAHVTFDAEEAGMTAWVCCRYESRTRPPGPWGPPASAVIP
jgi:hypothetical protein